MEPGALASFGSVWVEGAPLSLPLTQVVLARRLQASQPRDPWWGGTLALEFKVKALLATWVSAATAAATGHVEGGGAEERAVGALLGPSKPLQGRPTSSLPQAVWARRGPPGSGLGP